MYHAIVTGAGKGIGKATVVRLAEAGFSVIFNARTVSDLIQLESELQSRFPEQQFIGIPTDMSVKEEVVQFGKEVLKHFSNIHLLVNNAGVFLPGTIAEEPEGAFEMQMNTNVASAYYLTRLLLPAIKQSDKALIINMCSTASITAYVNGGSYCISKFALLGMSKVLREELKSTQVAVTSILPGATLTNSWAGTSLPESRFMKASDVAEIVIQAWNLSPSAVLEEVLLRPLEGDFD